MQVGDRDGRRFGRGRRRKPAPTLPTMPHVGVIVGRGDQHALVRPSIVAGRVLVDARASSAMNALVVGRQPRSPYRFTLTPDRTPRRPRSRSVLMSVLVGRGHHNAHAGILHVPGRPHRALPPRPRVARRIVCRLRRHAGGPCSYSGAGKRDRPRRALAVVGSSPLKSEAPLIGRVTSGARESDPCWTPRRVVCPLPVTLRVGGRDRALGRLV